MAGTVLRLEDVRASDTALAGGKGANLGELAAKGFPIPPGFVVSADASRAFFASLELQGEIANLEGSSTEDLARRCASLQRRIVESAVPPPLADAIRQAHSLLVRGRDDVCCAVRSSATAEDLAGASFAGQHGTYYYVEAERLLEMIRRCWASLWSPEATSYRSTRGISHASVSMAVVVQEMVRSQVSGVAFTANPVSGDLGEIVIESSWGMGAAIVDGRVTPDRYVVGRDGLRFRERRIAEKRFMVPARLTAGSDQRLIPVPEAMRRLETLRPDQVATVAGWSLRCEELFGAPQDVEWAITGDRFHLLQSRPITTLRREPIAQGLTGQYVLFKSLAENFTDPLTPLTADMMVASIPVGFRLIGGRIYSDLRFIRPLVPFDMSDAELADVLYLTAANRPPLRLSLRRIPSAGLAALLFYLTFAVVFARTRGMPDDFMDGYRDLCRRVEGDTALGPLEGFRRLFLVPAFLDPIGRMALFVNLASLRFAPWTSALKMMLRSWAPAAGADAVALLCSGTDGVLSAEMGRAVAALARDAKGSSKVAELLLQHPPEEALVRLREEPAAREFVERLDGFLAVHGHRAIREFELSSARWEDNPAQVLGMVRNYLLSESDPLAHAEKAARARSLLEAEIRGRLAARPLERSLRLRWRLIELAAGRARYYFKLRENSRFYHIMAVGTVRKKVLRVEKELLAQGRLRCRDDIFFLRFREIEALQEGGLGWLDVEDRVRERRMEHVRLAKMTPPRTFGIERLPPAAAEPGGGDRLQGQCASPGRFEGVARVILDPSVDAALLPGEVLVAPYTDPAWTPLFLTAGAAVVEVGSYLSHAGTVAREYGMPCVVDVADCTRRIPTGARVEVDGDRGTVRILAGGGVG
jgi:phosphohistidine swiveling domain-containing protein